MKRNYGLDLMRIFLSLCVITVHSINHFGFENGYVSAIFQIFFLQANGAFFMLSGYFNLEKEFNTTSDYIKYYKSKIINILIPFVAFVFVWALWDYLHINSNFIFNDFVSYFYETLMISSSYNHMWFMYPLIGLLISTPFLSKMLHHMSNKELKILWYVALAWNITCYYLCYDLGTDFRFLCWILEGWFIYYFAGYYYRHVASKESVLKWALLGIFGLVFTVVGQLFFEPFTGTTDIQPMYTIFTMGCLLFWDKAFHIKNEKIGKIVGYLSRHTFLIYLFHMRGMEYALRKFSVVEANFGNGLLVVIGTFMFSLIASIVANFLLKPLQKLIDKVWKVQ